MYDIIYSVLYHQSIDYVNNHLDNLHKYNNNNKYKIIAHLSDELYKNKHLINKYNLIINKIHSNKVKCTHMILKAIIDNFYFLIKKNIIFYNFIIISSNNVFVRQSPRFENNEITLNIRQISDYDIDYLSKEPWRHWKNFLKNNYILKNFQKNSIIPTKSQISGTVYTFNLMKKIYEYITKYRLLENIKCETYFEEIIIPSLAMYYTNEKPKCYCYIFQKRDKVHNNKLKIVENNDIKKILEINPNIFIIKIKGINNSDYNLIQIN